MTTLVLIPGLLSDERVWRPLAEISDLAAHHADVTRESSITVMAERLLSETSGRLIAVGHSMGGRVAMEMARIAPERVQGLVLANTGHHPRRDGEEVKRQQMIDLGHRDIAELARCWLPPMLDPARADDAILLAELAEMVVSIGPVVHERQIRALLTRPDASAYLSEIRCPVLLVAAHKDNWSPVAQHREIARAIPDAEMMVIDHAGHFAPVERPAEVARIISDWITRTFGETHD